MMDAADWDARYAKPGFVWTDTPNEFLVEFTGGLAPGRALDLAGGEGRSSVWLAERGWEATCVDFSPVGLMKAVELATARGVTISTVEADASTWRCEDPFDLVVVLYLQLPQPARSRALDAAAASVAPGGTLLVVAHDVDNVTEGFGGPGDPAVCYSAAGVTDVLDGFEIIEAGQRMRTVTTPDGPAAAIDTVVVARRPAS